MDINKLEVGKKYYMTAWGGGSVTCVSINLNAQEARFEGNIYAGSSMSSITMNEYEIRLHII